MMKHHQAGSELLLSILGLGRRHRGWPAILALTLLLNACGHATISIPGKPRPQEETYHHCPAKGAPGGDPELDLLKNRIDLPPHPQTWTFHRLLHLPWPKAVDGVAMKQWSVSERRQVDRYEGSGVRVVGYIASVSVLPIPESANCYGLGGFDTHLWLASRPRAPRKDSIVTEVTPRVEARESGFDEDQMDRLAREGAKVRITGWLFLDNRHDSAVEKIRATLWEIHPVTRIDVWRGGRWVEQFGS
ncbi:MAG: hypothetical protein M3Z66_19450 [Chloroflexota bacterium]|nr:hypothetical protein [Chloroflexota bacterium]